MELRARIETNMVPEFRRATKMCAYFDFLSGTLEGENNGGEVKGIEIVSVAWT